MIINKRLKVYKIVLVGCGNIGFRYYQSLSKLNLNIELSIFDKQKKRYNNFFNKKNGKLRIIKIDKLDNIKKKIDLLIIATTSNVRVKILNKILKLANLKKVILEKTLCQTIRELNTLKRLNAEYNLDSWVSSPKSTWRDYLLLKKKINYKKDKPFYVNITGSNWGFASNTIHHLHLIDFLFKKPKIISTFLSKSNNWFESKRNSFFDTHGVYKIKYTNNSLVTLKDFDNTKSRNWKMIINYNNQKIMVNEFKNTIFTKNKKKLFNSENLSENYKNVLKEILLKGKTKLPSLDNSINKHYFLIKNFLASCNAFTKQKYNTKLPVT